MAKRFTFADAKAKIKDLEKELEISKEQAKDAKNLDTSDNIYTKEENEEIMYLKKSTSLESWFYYFLWSFIPFIGFKWAFFGSKRFPWAQPHSVLGLIVGAVAGILSIIFWTSILAAVSGTAHIDIH